MPLLEAFWRKIVKYLLAIVLSIFSLTAVANEEEFTLRVNDGVVEVNMSDWQYLSNEATYHFYLAKKNMHVGNGFHKIHSISEFKEPEGRIYSGLSAPVKYIISFGYMDCNDGIFNLVGQLFTDKNYKIIYSSSYEYGEHRVEVTSPNTARNKAYTKVCMTGRDA
jgi:hypothetical protein